MNFLLVELGTRWALISTAVHVAILCHVSASLDGTQQLIIKGKFQQKQIETVLRRYISEYIPNCCPPECCHDLVSHRGICDMPHLSITRDKSSQGDTIILPTM